MRQSDWTYLYNLVNTLDSTIRIAVQATGLPVNTLEYVRPNAGFVGADACSSKSAFISVNQWLVNPKKAMLHPDTAGHILMSASLTAAVNDQNLP